jgi:hypothetical protein
MIGWRFTGSLYQSITTAESKTMHKYILSSLLLFTTSTVHAFTPPVEVIEYIDDVKIVGYLDQNDIKKSAQWAPFENPPPLSINDALISVKQYLKKNNEFNNTKLIDIELKRIAHYEAYWHYIVKTRYQDDAARKSRFYMVLMNGKVVSALKEPESIK